MPELIAFNRGVPPAESFPKEQIIASAARVIRNEGDHILQYGGPMGYPPLREWIARRFRADERQVIIGQGSLQLLDTFIKTSLLPGERVLIEQPSYDRVLTIFKRAQVALQGFALINGSMQLEQIAFALKAGSIPKAFYVIPDFQNPGGAEMPLETRRGLVELARRYDFLLIEDGAYRHLRYRGEDLPSLYDLDAEHVLHMSSFSKVVSPGMRVGFMVGRPDLISRIADYAENTYINPSHLNQAIIHDFIQRGLLDDHVERLKRMYGERMDHMLDSLEKYMAAYGAWIQPKGGFFAGVFLEGGKKQPEPRALEESGLRLTDGRAFMLEGGENFLRLPFAALTPSRIDEGVRRLAGLLK